MKRDGKIWNKSGLELGEGGEIQRGMIKTKIKKGRKEGMEEREGEGVNVERERKEIKNEHEKENAESEWMVLTIYRSGDGEGEAMEDMIRKMIIEEREETIIIGGDFNARIGEEGGIEEVGYELGRKSRDKIVNKEGKKLVNLISEVGGYFLNGTTEGDREGEYTYIGARGNTVIDYVIVNEIGNENVKKLEIDCRVDSDHLPVILTMGGRGKEKKKEEEEKEEKGEKRMKIVWDKKAREQFEERTKEGIGEEDEEGGVKVWTIEERWEKLKGWIEDEMIRKEVKFKKRVLGEKDWWDKSCTKGKRKVKRIFRKWRKELKKKEEDEEEKRRWKELLERKKKEKREEEEKKLKSLKKEADIWKFINKRRRRKEWINNKISAEEWKNYFQKMLEGKEKAAESEEEDKVDRKKEREEEKEMEKRREEIKEGGSWEEEKEEITSEEIFKAIKKLKEGKAVGADGIPNEAWKFGGAALKRGLVELIRQVWDKNSIPEIWKKGIIVPLHKKGDTEKTENYRGISLLCTAYKIYAEVLREKLQREVDEKELLPKSQAGFRKGRSTMDNIYILNHLAQRVKKEKGRMYAFFVDLRAAFDNVNREILWKILEEKKIKEQLRKRIMKIYEDTRMCVRVKEGRTEEFRTEKGVRQGCVLSPLLFNLYTADLDDKLRKRNLGGIKLGEDRILMLAYADDLVLLAKNREAMQDMIGTLSRFLKERKLSLNVEKSKIMVFNDKRKREGRKEKWLWEKKEMEVVENLKYLGFTFNRKGDYTDHIRELRKKGKVTANKVWGLGEKMCSGDFRRRWVLFKYLVRSVMEYGVEVWGWEERKELEKVYMDYTGCPRRKWHNFRIIKYSLF